MKLVRQLILVLCALVLRASPAKGFCGDGVIDPGEACDDGNKRRGDGCSKKCKVKAHWHCQGEPSVCYKCGNGVIDPGQKCDDGNTVSGDGCTNFCNTSLEVRDKNNTDLVVSDNYFVSEKGNGIADPTCANGILNKDICCSAECTVCGGSGCSLEPAGSADKCCTSNILGSGLYCTLTSAPCIMVLGATPEPTEAPTDPPTKRPTERPTERPTDRPHTSTTSDENENDYSFSFDYDEPGDDHHHHGGDDTPNSAFMGNPFVGFIIGCLIFVQALASLF